jgi:riboflavin kinase/FMN adenylyltransferase
MQIVRSLDRLPPALRGGAVTIGNFDGVHRGHATILERLVEQAKRVGGPAVVFTFDPHPLTLLRPEAAPVPLMTLERKASRLAELGVSGIVAYPTDKALLGLEPAAFFDLIVREKLAAKAMVEGPNFHFGRGRAGNVDVLRTLCNAAGVALEVVQPLATEGGLISSSRIRELIQAGKVGQANQLLSRPYQLEGVVSRGAERGSKIGFPTANLEQVATVLPAPGVYAARAWVDGQPYAAAVNVGPNPTFGEQALKIEVHLIEFSGNLYGRRLPVDFLDRLRDIQPFPSVDALVAQLRLDVAEARELCSCSSSLNTNH